MKSTTSNADTARDVFGPGRTTRLGSAGEASWIEVRPSEGRAVLVRREPGGEPVDLTPVGRSCHNGIGYGGIHGARPAWITWDHPRIPWDGSSPWVAAP